MKQKNFLKVSLNGTFIYTILVIVLIIIYSKLVIIVPKFIEYALDGVIYKNEIVIPNYISFFFYNNSWQSKILVLTIYLILINLCIFFVSYTKSKIGTLFNLKINENIKQSVLEHISNIEYLSYSKIKKSDITQRVNNDADVYSDFFNSIINLFLDTIFIIGFSIQEILKLSSLIGTFIFIICLLIILLSLWYFKISKPLVEDIVDKNEIVIKKTTNSVINSKMLKAFNRQDDEKSEFKKVNDQYKKSDIKLTKINVIYGITTHSLRNFKEPFILLVGGILVVKGDLTLVGVMLLITYSTKITDYIYNSVVKLQDLNKFLVAYKKLSNLMSVIEEDSIKKLNKLDGNIIFENVSIIINDKIYLKNLNFELKKNENIAIIGDNGSGKTLIAKTLLGFYNYTGDIYIGNLNIKEVNQKSIRRYIGIVLQDTYMFNDSIRNNINVANKNLTDDDIVRLCKISCLENDIALFDDKYDHILENNGSNISGGQKQRIAIARTLAMDTEYVIFDDSLSKLDSATKLEILNNLIKMNKGTIIISHDRNVVEKCDHVLFIDNNNVIYDTHTNLLNNPNYSKFIDVDDNVILEED
ncbi:MAG: ABC transporter ATP-binding protein [bacterium]|nr:ABC transporter ATP-binding protein [bacterium]